MTQTAAELAGFDPRQQADRMSPADHGKVLGDRLDAAAVGALLGVDREAVGESFVLADRPELGPTASAASAIDLAGELRQQIRLFDRQVRREHGGQAAGGAQLIRQLGQDLGPFDVDQLCLPSRRYAPIVPLLRSCTWC